MNIAGEGPGQTGHRVFISYCSEGSAANGNDSKVADLICSSLESQGIPCWIAPRDILPGADWMEAITDAVDQTKIVILVFSGNTEKSKWVNQEIKLAIDGDKTIIPFRIQDVSPQRALKLLKVSYQWLDAFTPPLENHLKRLIEVVCRHLGIKPVKPLKTNGTVEPGANLKEKPWEADLLPGEVKNIVSAAEKVEKNKNGYWEAYYQDGIVMVYIPPGEFTMGSEDAADDEKPLHKVYVDAYWMGKTELTVGQFKVFTKDTGHITEAEKSGGAHVYTGGNRQKKSDANWRNPYFPQEDNSPVVCVSWNDVAAYCQWLSGKTGLKFKLPTEAQWEMAARSIDSRKFPWGSREPDRDLANFNNMIGKTTPVGSYPAGASPYGILDMAGNVWEWCNDWYGNGYYKNSPKKNPPGLDSGSLRVMRGGDWIVNAGSLHCANRGKGTPHLRFNYVGFRLSQEIPESL